jgi:Ca2+-transporting ATPase
LVTEIGVLQRIFGTASLSLNQWLACIGIAVSLLVIEEVIKLVQRQAIGRQSATALAVDGATVVATG